MNIRRMTALFMAAGLATTSMSALAQPSEEAQLIALLEQAYSMTGLDNRCDVLTYAGRIAAQATQTRISSYAFEKNGQADMVVMNNNMKFFAEV